MARYMQDSTDIQINEVSGTDNINFTFKSGNSLSQEINNINTKIGNLDNLETPTTNNLVGAINSIVESGSNANGDYIKYSDGTMICTKKVSFVGLQFTTVWGNAYETPPVYLGDYAQEFVDIPLMFISCASSTAAAEGLGNTKTSYGSVTFYRPIRTDATTYSYTFYLMAIGKWR